METSHEPSRPGQPVPAAAQTTPTALALPPVWIRLPDLGADAVVGGETLTTVRSDRERQRRARAETGPHHGSSLVALGAVVILGVTLYLVLPARDRGGPAAPDGKSASSLSASPTEDRWQQRAAESELPGDTPAPPPTQEDQTAAGPPRLPDARPGADHKRYQAIAEFDGTIQVDPRRRARHERNGPSLY